MTESEKLAIIAEYEAQKRAKAVLATKEWRKNNPEKFKQYRREYSARIRQQAAAYRASLKEQEKKEG